MKEPDKKNDTAEVQYANLNVLIPVELYDKLKLSALVEKNEGTKKTLQDVVSERLLEGFKALPAPEVVIPEVAVKKVS